MIRRFTGFAASLVLAGGVCVAAAGPGSAATGPGVGAWTLTSNGLSLVRHNFRATTLPDGRVLAEGGFAPGSYTPEAEIYTPATDKWTVASPMHQGRGEQSAVLLKDGRVLVAGGYAGPVLSEAEIFDPSTGQWQVTGSMHAVRTRFAAVRLCDGRVLAAGGWDGGGIASAEIYDPSTGQWSMTGSLPTPVQTSEGFLLPDCTVLIPGATQGPGNGTPSAASYIFHPDTGTFTATASMHYPRTLFSGVTLPDGRIMVMGGDPPGSSATAEIYDPATHQWSVTAPMHDPHILGEGEEAQLLPDGRVLVPGDTANPLKDELYDPATNTWSFTKPQNAAHNGGVTALLQDGRVLNAGGGDSSGTLTPAAETYSPAPVAQVISITGPGTGTYGGTATLTATGGGSGNPVVFTVDSSSTAGACAVSGTNGSGVTYTGTGNCVIDANQAGGDGYRPADQVQQTIKVSPAPLTITASSPTMTYGGEPPVIKPIYAGFVAGDTPASLTTQPTCTTTVTSAAPLGSFQPSTCANAGDPDYQISYVPGLVHVILGNYVSMGDSFSSGEGLGGYTGDSDKPGDRCHRSPLAYPTLLFNADPLSLLDHPTYVACSGAETPDFLYSNHDKANNLVGPQITALGASTNVVTFTIGGNDVGFSQVLHDCVHVSAGKIHNEGYNCSRNHSLVMMVKTRIAALEGLASANNPSGSLIISIQKLLQEIHSHALNAAIFVGGYPHLFGSSIKYFQQDNQAPGKYVCTLGAGTDNTPRLTIDYADAQWLNSEADALDSAIATAVSQAQDDNIRVTYIGAVQQHFATHNLCDSGKPWLNKVSLDFTLNSLNLWRDIKVDRGSLHPNTDGQRYGYEPAFAGN